MELKSYRKNLFQDASLINIGYVGFYDGRRQFIYKVYTCTKIRRNKEKLYLQDSRVHAEYRRCDPYINISNRIKD